MSKPETRVRCKRISKLEREAWKALRRYTAEAREPCGGDRETHLKYTVGAREKGQAIATLLCDAGLWPKGANVRQALLAHSASIQP